jgi:MoaA/NifB/PqqE/SkfB family radical SAM enzyme
MGFVFNYIRNMASMALGQEPSQPLLFSYYVTHRCELNCRYCCDGDGKRFKEDPIPELSTAEVKRLISILRGATDTLDITGGEPMVLEDLEDILSFARQRGLRTVLNTKGIGIEQRPDLMRFTKVLVLSLDTLEEPVGNILTEEVAVIRGRLKKLQQEKDCNHCWTSCRGFAESMYRPPRIRQFREFYTSVKRH